MKYIDEINSLPSLYKVELSACFITDILAALTYASTTKIMIEGIDEDVLSWRMIISALLGVFIGGAYIANKNKIFKHFQIINVTEIVLYGLLIAYLEITWNFNVYFLVAAVVGAFVGNFVVNGNMMLHEKITDDENARVNFRLLQNITSRISTLAGAGAALFVDFEIRTLFIVMFFGMTLDNIMMFYVYNKLPDDKKM
ncbi:MAG: hypothetical protein J6K01_05620 [Paludibacteraceae bacterium]|nr:hypothetical protein [Paludibacteraceae bacterium]